MLDRLPPGWLHAGLLFFAAVDGARCADELPANVSYDVAREFYKDFNAAFVADYKKTTGKDVKIDQSHGGSSAQARAVADGLDADVVTMNTSRPTSTSSPSTGRGRQGLAPSASRTTPRRPRRPWCSWCARATRRASRTGTTWSSPACRSIVAEPQDRRQRPLHLPGGLGLREEEGRHATRRRASSSASCSRTCRCSTRGGRDATTAFAAAQHRRRADHLRERGRS